MVTCITLPAWDISPQEQQELYNLLVTLHTGQEKRSPSFNVIVICLVFTSFYQRFYTLHIIRPALYKTIWFRCVSDILIHFERLKFFIWVRALNSQNKINSISHFSPSQLHLDINLHSQLLLKFQKLTILCGVSKFTTVRWEKVLEF